MAVNKTCYKIVIASPSDVQAERKIIVEAIKITNEIFKESNVFLEPYMWETDAYPSFHPEGPQGVIDESLKIENSDILIGIFYLKLGTPTNKSESGTIHEIKQAIELFENKGIPEIKLYFKKPIIEDLDKLDKSDFEQFENVKKFKKTMFSKGIIGEFESINIFKDKLIKDFTRFLLIKTGVISNKKREIKKEVLKVEDEIEFVKNIGSNKELILTPNTYNLSNLGGYLRRENIYHEEVYDGLEIIIKGVNNLSIISDGGESKLLVTPQYANVLTFRDSKNIIITNLVLGHDAKPGECAGGVLVFENCKNIIINNSILFGCGIEGLKLSNVDTFIFNSSIIRKCTQSIMSISNSNNTFFRKSKFEKNQIIFYGVGTSDFSFIEFDECIFSDNYSWKESKAIKSELISPSINSNILIRNSQLINNSISHLAERLSLLNIENVLFKGNRFKETI